MIPTKHIQYMNYSFFNEHKTEIIDFIDKKVKENFKEDYLGASFDLMDMVQEEFGKIIDESLYDKLQEICLYVLPKN